jgi:hypothetical protein
MINEDENQPPDNKILVFLLKDRRTDDEISLVLTFNQPHSTTHIISHQAEAVSSLLKCRRNT